LFINPKAKGFPGFKNSFQNLISPNSLIISFKNDLMPTISNIRECLICNNIGKYFGLKFSLHLKVDTGMSRLGFEYSKFV